MLSVFLLKMQTFHKINLILYNLIIHLMYSPFIEIFHGQYLVLSLSLKWESAHLFLCIFH